MHLYKIYELLLRTTRRETSYIKYMNCCSGQREEKHLSYTNTTKHDNGSDANGHDLHPPLLRPRRRFKQYL